MRSKAKMKLSLLASMGVSLLAVASASISTFAWFQAQADVTIIASGASTTITVTKGLDYTYYVYKGNFKNFDTSSDLVGYTTAPASTTGTFLSDFAVISSSSGVTPTKASDTTNLWPGEKLTYAVKVTGITNNKIKMYLKSYTSTSANGTYKRYIKGETNTIVDMAMAMDIYTMSSTNGAGYYDATSASTKAASFLNKTATDGLTDKFNYPTVTSYENTNPLYETTSAGSFSSGTIYIFFTVMYSNLQKDLYKEETQGGSSEIEPAGPNTDRYFKHYETGGYSNCFQGLTYQINTLELDNN